MKQALAVLLLFFLPMLLLIELINFSSTTGDVVNDLARTRLERLTLARSPFYGRIDSDCRAHIRGVDQLLRLGADERYYTQNGLTNNPAYYVNERTLFERLLAMRHPNTPCTPELKEQSLAIERQIAQFNINLGNTTMHRKTCHPDAQWYFDQAAFLSTREPITSINYLEHALSLCSSE